MVGRPRDRLSGHALAETYSVLTRLPGDLRLTPADAARLLGERFAAPLLLGHETASRLPAVLGTLGIAGGAVYDALVALAALEHGADLARAMLAPSQRTTPWVSVWWSPSRTPEPGYARRDSDTANSSSGSV